MNKLIYRQSDEQPPVFSAVCPVTHSVICLSD